MSLAHSHVDLTFWINLAKANSAGKVPISLRITIFGKRAEVSTKIRCFPAQWDKATKRLIPKDRFDISTANLNTVLDDLEAKARLTASDVRRAATAEAPYSASAVRDALVPPPPKPDPCVLLLLDKALASYPNLFTQAYHVTSLRALRRYVGEGKSLPLPQLTPAYVKSFRETVLAERGLKTTKGYLDNLRALFSRACPTHANPFTKEGLTGRRTTTVRPRYVLTRQELATLSRLELSKTAAVARDIYMAQYYLHGSRVGVVLEMEWAQVDWQKGRVRFLAEKGGDWHDVALRPALAVLLRAYWSGPGTKGLIFPLLPADYASQPAVERFKLRRAALTRVWNGLQAAAKKMKLPGRLHSHTARHTLATHTVQTTGNFRLAQQLLGHTDLAMTEKYIKSMLPTELDEGADAVYGAD